MAWTIEFEKRADKEFSRLSASTQRRILTFLKEREDRHPKEYSLQLSGQSMYSRIRVGDYRLIIRIEEQRRSMYILYIGHRKDVYRP